MHFIYLHSYGKDRRHSPLLPAADRQPRRMQCPWTPWRGPTLRIWLTGQILKDPSSMRQVFIFCDLFDLFQFATLSYCYTDTSPCLLKYMKQIGPLTSGYKVTIQIAFGWYFLVFLYSFKEGIFSQCPPPSQWPGH